MTSASRIAGTRFPADRLRPDVGHLDRRPDERALGVHVSMTIGEQQIGQVVLEPRVLACAFRVMAQEVTEELRELLRERACPSNMDVSAPLSGDLPEVPLRELRVVGSPDESASFDLRSVALDRLQRRNRDLHVDDRLGVEAGHGGRSDVVDPHGSVAEFVTQPCSQAGEQARPGRVVGGDERLVLLHEAMMPDGGPAGDVSRGRSGASEDKRVS